MPVSEIRACSQTCDGSCFGDRQPHQDFAAFGELDGVADELGEDLPQPDRIAPQDRRNGAVDVYGELHVLARACHPHGPNNLKSPKSSSVISYRLTLPRTFIHTITSSTSRPYQHDSFLPVCLSGIVHGR